MKAKLQDKVLGTLAWDEDTETYAGEAKLGDGRKIPLEITVHNADEISPRELEAFLGAVRKQFQRITQGNKQFEAHAAGLFEKALKKANRPAVSKAQLAKSLELAGLEMDNGGMTRIKYSVGDIWPKKTVSFFVDSSDNIV